MDLNFLRCPLETDFASASSDKTLNLRFLEIVRVDARWGSTTFGVAHWKEGSQLIS